MAPSIIWKGEEKYEEARVGRIFNRKRPNRFPAGVLHAHSVDDVIYGVNLAREKGMKITVRSGGHSWPAWSLRDGSLLIDLEHLKELHYDPKTEIVTVSASSTGRMINVDYLSKLGRMFPGGHCPSVAVGGFLLQGGQGWNCRGWKWGCEMIDSMDVVTPDGKLVTASETENSDLFWAARGAGLGFFGVVVRFRLKTFPAFKAMRKTILIFDAKHYDETFNWFQRTCPTVDLDVELVYLGLSRMRCLPDSPGKPSDPLLVISATAFKNTIEECADALAPFLQCPKIDEALVHAPNIPTSFKEEYDTQERDNPPDCRFWANNAWINGEPQEVTDALRHGFLELPTPDSYTLYYSQAPVRKLPNMAFDMQTPHYYASYIMSTDTTGSSDNFCQAWIQEAFYAIDARHGGPGGSPGQYLGDSDQMTRPARIMSDEHWDKFVKIRQKYDPNGLFSGFNVGLGIGENMHVWEAARRVNKGVKGKL
ncbi:FAD linked oxidase domain-containing protein [Meredithblackwellia eburnea MCA 4105]